MTDKEFKAVRAKVNEMKRLLKEIDECGQAYPDKEERLLRELRDKAQEVASDTANVLSRV